MHPCKYALVHLGCNPLSNVNSNIGILDFFFNYYAIFHPCLVFNLIRLLSSGRERELHFQGVLDAD